MNNHLVDVSPCYSCSVRSCNNLHRAAASHFLVRSTVKGEFWRDLPKPGLNDFFLHSRSWNEIFVHLRCWSTLLFSLHPMRYVKNKKKNVQCNTHTMHSWFLQAKRAGLLRPYSCKMCAFLLACCLQSWFQTRPRNLCDSLPWLAVTVQCVHLCDSYTPEIGQGSSVLSVSVIPTIVKITDRGLEANSSRFFVGYLSHSVQ